ncbi:hypothetical protein ONS95_007201 [Cadophora gregata]|uniref:uncharacterized protein n=1 Tax=Cadophora gregata TaxID=51156 RepID=UPI0026DD5C47|nr:uncharacterized protein ONS95_007201 [Cadophora gregata]KAK0100751.1 hypothetical protein ONS95_007201 [Cadophora gregata]KAK0117254.1 hypothetical protein ONS96_013087 [Cadophora gregata f. sp. sojae]
MSCLPPGFSTSPTQYCSTSATRTFAMGDGENTVVGSKPAPPGVTPNFEHPQDVFYTINLIVQIACIALTTPCVLLRLYIRAKVVKIFGIEDWCCAIAWVFATYFFASGIVLGEEGGGYHDWELTKPAFRKFKKTLYFDIMLHSPTTFFVKATLLLIFIRVFSPMSKAVRAIYGFMIILLLYYTAQTAAKIWVCSPIGAFWNPAIRKSCINTRIVFRIDNAVSVITDLVILILPIPLLWSVQMTRKKKIGIGMLLGAGGLATICSAARMILTLVRDIPDATLGATNFKMLAVSELAIALACACVPSFHVLYSRLSEKSKAKRSGYTSSVKMSTFGSSSKGSRGIKAKPGVVYMEGRIDRPSSLEHILHNTANPGQGYGYRVQVFSDMGAESSNADAMAPPETCKQCEHDQRTIRITKTTEMV